MLMWKYGEHKAGLIIPCVISAVKSTPPMRAGTTTQLCLPFLLTRLSRGVTGRCHSPSAENCNFYSHAPRGARLFALNCFAHILDFYSHAPRGARRAGSYGKNDYGDFYSHAPRGARHPSILQSRMYHYFYSHAPRGARRNWSGHNSRSCKFLLTRPSRGATQ